MKIQMPDFEFFYFATQRPGGMRIGYRALGARALVRELRRRMEENPALEIVSLYSLSDPDDDPLRGVAFFPSAVERDDPRDTKWLREHAPAQARVA